MPHTGETKEAKKEGGRETEGVFSPLFFGALITHTHLRSLIHDDDLM